MKKYGIKAAVIGAAVMAGVSSCSVGGKLDANYLNQAMSTGLQALTISDAEIMEYSRQSVAQMDAKAKIAPANNEYTKRLARLTNGLTTVDGIPLNFKVYLTNDINAFACPDGSVRVYSGIMDMMDDNELLGIIGHEIGHVAMHHSRNAMKQALMNSALRDVIASTGKMGASLTSGQLGQLGDLYLSSKYSRKQENEADDFGYEFLKGAGKNPWAMAKAFEKMQVLEAQSAGGGNSVIGGLNDMFSDHPATSERIKRMSERATKDGYKR